MAVINRMIPWIEALAIVASMGALGSCQEQRVGAVLTYEVDPAVPSAGAPAELLTNLVTVVGQRLGDEGKVRQLDNGRFAVDIYDAVDDQRLTALRRRIGAMGVLEFRIMASPKFPSHRAAIDTAMKLSADVDDVMLDDQLVARWLDCNSKEFPDEQAIHQRGLVVRKGNQALQALAMMDDGLDVTGKRLKSASSALDETGRPQLAFEFDAKGAPLFGQLTGLHVPTDAGLRYNLGIVLDKRLMSAPTIESKITDKGRISGNMTQEEVDGIVAILNAGQLPCSIREVTPDTPQ